MPRPSPSEQVRFLQNIQRLLDEGSFVATYKFALLLALADLSVELGDDLGTPLTLSTKDIAERFVRYYWRQALPFPGVAGQPMVLSQNTGRQAAIVNDVAHARESGDNSIVHFKSREAQWKSLLRRVDRIVQTMPLWKLQTIGGTRLEFLYLSARGGRVADSIELLPGVATCLREFHGLVRSLVQAAWVNFVRELPANRGSLGHNVDLAEFLFGSERDSLGAYRPILREIQGDLCFYCRKPMRSASEIDHFIPWTRYPHDLGHNFVLAHATCNRAKASYLAAEEHLEEWSHRNDTHRSILAEYFRANEIAASIETSKQITAWAYARAEQARAQIWVEGSTLRTLSASWRQSLALPVP